VRGEVLKAVTVKSTLSSGLRQKLKDVPQKRIASICNVEEYTKVENLKTTEKVDRIL
jgi:hypothetical protein